MKSVEFLQWTATVILLATILISLIAAIRGTPTDRHIGRLLQNISAPLIKKSSLCGLKQLLISPKAAPKKVRHNPKPLRKRRNFPKRSNRLKS